MLSKQESSGSGNMVTLQNSKATAEKGKDGVVFCTPEMLFEFGEKGGMLIGDSRIL